MRIHSEDSQPSNQGPLLKPTKDQPARQGADQVAARTPQLRRSLREDLATVALGDEAEGHVVAAFPRRQHHRVRLLLRTRNARTR